MKEILVYKPWMLKIIRSKGTSQTAMLTASKGNKWGKFEQIKDMTLADISKIYLKDKTNEPATNNKNKNNRDPYREMNEFNRDYQPRNNYVKNEVGDLLADSHNTLSRCKNYEYFSVIECAYVSDVRQIKMLTVNYNIFCFATIDKVNITRNRMQTPIIKIKMYSAEKLVPALSRLEVKIVTAKLKKYKLPGSVETLAELLQKGSETLRSEIHKLIHSIWNKEEIPDQEGVYYCITLQKWE
jgi:hypothetical protein